MVCSFREQNCPHHKFSPTGPFWCYHKDEIRSKGAFSLNCMTPSDTVNLLVIVVVSGRQADELKSQLVRERFYFTQIDSSGGPLQEPTVCLLIGLNQARLDPLMGVVQAACKRFQEYIPVQLTPPAGLPPMQMIEAQVGGALVYAVEVEQFIQF